MRAWMTILFTGVATVAQAAVLYDAATNTTPDKQGWAFLTSPLIAAQTAQAVENGVLTLDASQVVSEQGGYFSSIPALGFQHPLTPKLDLDVGPIAIEFSMRQVTGSDRRDTDPLAFGQRNRGGFAVIVISEDLAGIELQFQVDNIVALDDENSAFPIGEVLAFDTTDALHDYRLILSRDGYRLEVDGTNFLEGPLRNYLAVAPDSPLNFPYATPSFLFFGDDTPRGEALTELTRFEVSIFGDCTDDGVLDRDDLPCVHGIPQRDVLLQALNTMPGDLDGNGDVSFEDFVILATHFGQVPANYAQGNIDLMMDGVTLADFVQLASNFGRTPNQGAAAPEPKSSALTGLGIFGFLVARRRRRTAQAGSSSCGRRQFVSVRISDD